MSDASAIPSSDRELVISRLLDAPRESIFRCWTEAELLKRWFAPRPWTTSDARIDLRPGGASVITMRSPEGRDFPNRGVYLEVVANEKLVFTDAYVRAWEPAEKPFFTGIITLEDEDGKTRYTARARHWSAQDRDRHEAMGFHQGWNQCADQLEAVAKAL